MPLAAQSLLPVPAVAGAPALTCHPATWFWAAMEAQALGLTPVKAPLVTLMNIVGMPGGPQGAMMNLANAAGTWDFAIVPLTPPDGSVLVWQAHPTHSGVVSAANQVSGYNQVGQWPAAGIGHSSNATAALPANQRVVKVIPEDTIVAEAGRLGL